MATEGGAEKANTPSAAEAEVSSGEVGFQIPAGWGDAGRAAVIAKFEAEGVTGIDNDYLPPSDEEVAIIKQLVAGVADMEQAKTELEAVALLRFCRGFTLNQFQKLPREEAVAKTVEILRTSMEFFGSVQASSILQREIPRSYEYHKYWVNGVVGTDTFGRQIYLCHPPASRLIKQFKGSPELVLNHIVDMEKLKLTKRNEEAKRGLMLYKHVLILDGGITSMNLERLMFMKNAFEYNGTSIDSDFYPEMLYKAWIINAPLALRALWKMAKGFLNPITRKKFEVHGNVPLEKMAEDGLTLDNLPNYLGGNAANPQGFHFKETVKAGVTFERKWDVKQGQNVFWDMEMKGSYYLDVELSFNDAVVGKERIDESTETLFTGSFVAESDGVLTVKMHNDGRWHSRNVSYDVRVGE